MDDSAIIYDEIIDMKARSNNEETKIFPTNITYKTQSFYILLAFLLISIALLIAVSIYCYLIKYKTKQKHLRTFQLTNKKLKEIIY